jgi:magnesium transporter
MNLYSFKAIIKSDLVIFFDSIDHKERLAQRMFIMELQEKLSRRDHPESESGLVESLPFELRVVESILLSVCIALQQEFDTFVPKIEESLKDLEGRIHWDKLKILLECKKRINHFKNRVDNIRDCIGDVLNSDSDMANMYLTAKSHNIPRDVSAHEEVELLLENYLKMVDEISNRLQEIENNIASTEDIVNIGLVGQRNELLLFELKLTMGTFAAALGSFGASVFGMNLRSHLETHPSGFYITASALSFFCIFVYLKTWSRMYKLIKRK